MLETTVIRAVKAHKAITGLSGKQLPVADAMKLFKLKKSLQQAREFAEEEEKKLFDRFSPKAEDGFFHFASDEDAKAFTLGMKDIHDAEYDLSASVPVVISAEGLTLTVEDLEDLDGFVTFVGGD